MGKSAGKRDGAFWNLWRAVGAIAVKFHRLIRVGAVVAVVTLTALAAIGGFTAWTFIVLGAIAISLSGIDALADYTQRHEADATLEGAMAVSLRVVESLNSFSEHVLKLSKPTGDAATRQGRLEVLSSLMVETGRNILGRGSRVTFYWATGEKGQRKLHTPVHAVSGRYDEPYKPFVEVSDPDNGVWRALERADLEAPIFKKPHPDGKHEPGPTPDVDWDKVRYETFCSIPLNPINEETGDREVLGFLSGNSTHRHAIEELEKAALINLARTFTHVLRLNSRYYPHR